MESWLFFAVGAAFFAALTSILAKIGLGDVNSHLATAIRTVVVAVFAVLMVLIVGSAPDLPYVGASTWVFLLLSGLATGASWLCYFRALQLGSVRRVVPVDKSSTILTMLLAFLFLGETLGRFGVFGMILMAVGTWLMIERTAAVQQTESTSNSSWLFYAVLAAVFAALTAILGRVGIADVEANLGTAIRTMAVLPMAWLMVFITKTHRTICDIGLRGWVFLTSSGVATGASWLMFYRALQLGQASHVVPIDKLSIVLTMAFARIILGERFTWRSLGGLALLVCGTMLSVFVAA